MDRESFSDLIEMLEGLEWFIFSGAAVKIYGEGNREIGDIDFAVKSGDIQRFAERLETEVKDRKFAKNGRMISDRGFETEFRGIEVEATSGFPPVRIEQERFDKLFEYSSKRNFYGREVKVVPVEDLIIHKAVMSRRKDLADLKMLRDEEVDIVRFTELLDDWNCDEEKVESVLRKAGFSKLCEEM